MTTSEAASFPHLPPCAESGNGDAAVCHATLTFATIAVSVVLPVAASLCCWHAAPAKREQRGYVQLLSTLDRGLRLTVSGHPKKLRFALVCWYVAALCWMLCKTVAGLV